MSIASGKWPAWAEYASQDAQEANDADFAAAKRAVIADYGVDALRKGWIQTCHNLRSITEEIAAKGSSIIPIVNTAEVLESGFTPSQKAEIQRVGAFVCRATVPADTIKAHFDDLTKYVTENVNDIPSWPPESPSMLTLYNSPTQNALRSDPVHLGLQRKLNELWHGYDAADGTSPEPLVYLDGVRKRQPGQPFLGLGPHIDAGSLCRWAEPRYRKVYDAIFRGEPDAHDAFDIAARKDADQEMFPGIAHSTVLRTFQGWTALTSTAPREGTIMVYPNLKTVLAYMLLRPFFKPPQGEGEDVLDPELWTLDAESSWFPGTFKPQSQRLSRASHPHLRLDDCLVYMPPIEAGDTVWWHSDVCHAVDTEHMGNHDAAVAYIAACPTTPVNAAYVVKQLTATLEGKSSPDYAQFGEMNETRLKGYVGLDVIEGDARRAFGFNLLSTA